MVNVHAGPFIDILSSLGLITIGVLLYRHRREIGSLRGGSRGRTRPGAMLVPVAIALVAFGCIVFYRGLFGG